MCTFEDPKSETAMDCELCVLGFKDFWIFVNWPFSYEEDALSLFSKQ